jgi:hypothetical protein
MNLATAPNVVLHYFLYFSSPFANFTKGLEIRLSLSPAHFSRVRLCQTIPKCLSSYIWLLLWRTLINMRLNNKGSYCPQASFSVSVKRFLLTTGRHNRTIQKSKLKSKKQDRLIRESELKTDRHNARYKSRNLRPGNRIGRSKNRNLK